MLQANEINITPQSFAADQSPLFDRAIAAERLWRQHGAISGNTSPAAPEYERVMLEDEVLGDAYEALFREYCDFAIEHPSLETLGNVVVLWRLRCWDSNDELGEMADNFEARAIARISEILTGIKH